MRQRPLRARRGDIDRVADVLLLDDLKMFAGALRRSRLRVEGTRAMLALPAAVTYAALREQS